MNNQIFDPTFCSIDQLILNKRASKQPRSRKHLGASEIGHPCTRYLWLKFHKKFKEVFSGRILRLFERGRREEAIFKKELRSIGCTVMPGKKFEYGLFQGTCDALVLGVPEAYKTWHVAEFKTHSDKSYKELTKLGVQESHPQHYAQMQVYMLFLGFERALYLAVNKNDDDLHSERIRLDVEYAKRLHIKAQFIIESKEAPPRIGRDPSWYQCKMCGAKEVCWREDS